MESVDGECESEGPPTVVMTDSPGKSQSFVPAKRANRPGPPGRALTGQGDRLGWDTVLTLEDKVGIGRSRCFPERLGELGPWGAPLLPVAALRSGASIGFTPRRKDRQGDGHGHLCNYSASGTTTALPRAEHEGYGDGRWRGGLLLGKRGTYRVICAITLLAWQQPRCLMRNMRATGTGGIAGGFCSRKGGRTRSSVQLLLRAPSC